MKNKWILANYYHYGSDWSSKYREIFKSKNEAWKFEEAHREKYKNVSGVECVDFEYSYATKEELRSPLTFNEYTELFPCAEQMSDERKKVAQREYRLNKIESLTVMDMVQDTINRGMIASRYDISKIEEIISRCTNDFDDFTKEFEITIRIK